MCLFTMGSCHCHRGGALYAKRIINCNQNYNFHKICRGARVAFAPTDVRALPQYVVFQHKSKYSHSFEIRVLAGELYGGRLARFQEGMAFF